ncbi:hypothetical protein GGG17_14380 [Arsenicicoccus sp. MKL-02]|uniref:Type I restriction enzyme R protein C-terminal domain-containing protein n=1 Tax=Arsenicicoccus cauae TaxID=2663847 RepID=A0A6I3IFR4_9MICO|nr:hypothetical protein [Arsenicicoccus cauae]MTB73128.1 hypothetical protein [Arsenicicoccus cauae]
MSTIDELIAEHCPAGVPFKTLGEVGTFVRGNGLQKKDLIDDGVGAIHYGQVFTVYGTATTETKSFVDPAFATRLRKAKPGDLVIATTSENDVDVCKAVAWLGESDIAISGDAFVYQHSLDPLYVAYYFQTEAFQGQKRKFISGTKDAEKESINDDVVFEIELIKQVEVNVDHILTLVQAFRDSIGNSDREMDALMQIRRAVDSSPSLRNKSDLILQFVDSVSITGDTSEDWKIFVATKRDAELDSLIAEEALKADETKTFVANAFRDGSVPTAGTAITRILPPASRFSPGGDHGAKKQRVLDKLSEFFNRYFGLV